MRATVEVVVLMRGTVVDGLNIVETVVVDVGVVVVVVVALALTVVGRARNSPQPREGAVNIVGLDTGGVSTNVVGVKVVAPVGVVDVDENEPVRVVVVLVALDVIDDVSGDLFARRLGRARSRIRPTARSATRSEVITRRSGQRRRT